MREKQANFWTYLVLIIISFISIFPFVYMILSALKAPDEIVGQGLNLFPAVPQWENFLKVFDLAPFHLYIFNSFMTALAIVVLQTLASSMLAYALTQLKFKGKGLLFVVIMISYMIPSATTYVASYVFLSRAQLINTLTGYVLSNTANVFMIFLLRQSFTQVSGELIEAARISGASEWQIYRKIMLPLNKDVIFTTAILSFIGSYNAYMWPNLVLTSQENLLISIGLQRFFNSQGSFAQNWPLIMAGSTISILPLLIIFIVFQRYLKVGISGQGVKG